MQCDLSEFFDLFRIFALTFLLLLPLHIRSISRDGLHLPLLQEFNRSQRLFPRQLFLLLAVVLNVHQRLPEVLDCGGVSPTLLPVLEQ